jgi:hypothetical protein
MNQSNQQQNETVQQKPNPVPKKPNEMGSINVEGFVKIFDPNTQEKFVEKRA